MGQYKEVFKAQMLLQKQQNKELKFAAKNIRKIKKGFNHLVEYSRIILLYLQDDFKQKTILIENRTGIKEKCKISKEIEDVEQEFRIPVAASIMPPVKKRFIRFRVLHRYYKQLLDKLEVLSNKKDYKVINFKEEREFLEEYKEYVKYFDDVI